MKILFYGGTKIEQCEYTGRCWLFNKWYASLRAAKLSITKRKGRNLWRMTSN